MKKFQFYYLAILLLLITNVSPGKAAEEPFGSIVKLWETPLSLNGDYGQILVDSNRKIFVQSRNWNSIEFRNLTDGNLLKEVPIDTKFLYYQFIENKSKLVVFSTTILFYDCSTFELIKSVPFPDSMSFLTLFSEDGKFLIGSNSNAVVHIYDFDKKVLKDTIFLERAEEYGYSTKPPYSIKISPDNKYIFTATGYQKWQQFPNATVYNVYDITTKIKLLRYALSSTTTHVLSNDWKYLYVINRIDNVNEVDLYKIRTTGTEDIISQKYDNWFMYIGYMSDNDKYIIFKPFMEQLRYINSNDFVLKVASGIPPQDSIGNILQIKNGYLFTSSYGGLTCFNIKNSILSTVKDLTNNKTIIYPNPTNNIVTIDNINPSGKIFSMTNINGKTIQIMDKIKITGKGITIDLTGLSTGSYYFTIAEKNNSKTYTIIKY